jgi:hypothetical protein
LIVSIKKSHVFETEMTARYRRVEVNLVLKLVVAAFVVDVVSNVVLRRDVFDAAVAGS